MKIHYIKDNDLPELNDDNEKLLFVEDTSYDIGYRKEIGFHVSDGNFDNCEHGWVQGTVIAWSDIPSLC